MTKRYNAERLIEPVKCKETSFLGWPQLWVSTRLEKEKDVQMVEKQAALRLGKRQLQALLGFVGVLLWGWIGIGTSSATTFFIQPLPEKISKTPVIVRGIAGKSDSRWVRLDSGEEQVFTFTSFQVLELLKGKLSDDQEVVVRSFGGTIGNDQFKVPGAAQFNLGDEVVLMLSLPHSDGSHSVLGMESGQFGLRKDANGRVVLSGIGLNPSNHHHPVSEEEVAHRKDQNQPLDESRHSQSWSLDKLRGLIQRQKEKSAESPHESQSLEGLSPPSAVTEIPSSETSLKKDSKNEKVQITEPSWLSKHWATLLTVVLVSLATAAIFRRKS